jgi:NAD(P)-dependent dehydrogenase (short-subunit alcohol dehydrogenase family)
MNLLKPNWKLLAGIVGASLLSQNILRRLRTIDLSDKVVLITGGSRGLGLATAEAFAKQGARLVLCARDEQELSMARHKIIELGAEVLTIVCDVTKPQDAAVLVETATANYGQIDILVNNAGMITVGPLQTLTRDDFEASMNIMFWGVYNMTMAVLPQMKERKAGRIVNITSIGGRVSVPHLLPYCSAKFAAVGFSEGLRAELLPDNIYVTTVVPGLMSTGSHYNTIMKGDQHQTEYTLFTLLDTLPVTSTTAQRAAQAIVQATRQGRSELMITFQAQLMARFHGLLPGLFSEIMGLTNRFLPTRNASGTEGYAGRASETPLTRSFLTLRGRQAAHDYNEHSTH